MTQEMQSLLWVSSKIQRPHRQHYALRYNDSVCPMQVRLKTVVDFVGDTLGHTVKAAAAKAAAAAAREVAAQRLQPLVQQSEKALRDGIEAVTAEALKASLQPQIPDIRAEAAERVPLANSRRPSLSDACHIAACAPPALRAGISDGHSGDCALVHLDIMQYAAQAALHSVLSVLWACRRWRQPAGGASATQRAAQCRRWRHSRIPPGRPRSSVPPPPLPPTALQLFARVVSLLR